MMKKLLLFIFFFYSFLAQATDYFVSTSGDDANNGTSKATPWQTLAKVQSSIGSFLPGDRILFKRGDTFKGQLLISGLNGSATNPIYIGAYGYGDQPVFDGSIPVPTFSVFEPNIWVATITNYHSFTNMKAVYYDNTLLERGRTPNSGEFYTNDVDYWSPATYNNKKITDFELSDLWPTDYWKGGKIAVYVRDFMINVNTVASHTGDDINLTLDNPNIDNYGSEIGRSYFFTDHLETLDREGEWYYDEDNKQLYLYSATNPNDHIVEVPYYATVFRLTNCKYITVQYITFMKSTAETVKLENADNCRILSNRILFSAENALETTGSDYNDIGYNYISQTQNSAMPVNGNNNYYHDNQILNTAMIPGQGFSGNGTYMGLYMSGRNNVAEFNEIRNVGYNGIHFGGDTPYIISRNLIENAVAVKADGGYIYCFQDTALHLIEKNILIGDQSLTNPGLTSGIDSKKQGLYADAYTALSIWRENTVIDVGASFLAHNNNRVNIWDNKFVGYMAAGVRSTNTHATNAVVHSNSVQRNVFVTANDKYPDLYNWTRVNNIESYGFYGNNKHVVPLSSVTPGAQQPNALYLREISGSTEYQEYFTPELAGLFDAAKYGGSTSAPVSFDRYTINSVNDTVSANHNMNTAFSNTVWYTGSANSATFSHQRLNTGNWLIDGYTMVVNFSASALPGHTGVVLQRNIPIAPGMYKLTFTGKSSSAAHMKFTFKTQSNGTIHTVRTIKIDTAQQTYNVVFQVTETSTDGRIQLNFYRHSEGEQTIALDNMFVSPVSVTENSYSNRVRVEYNASKQSKSVTLTGEWATVTDVDGNAITWPITLAPYESKILIKQ